ncbi:MAG: LamG-like jellyroll fold domain-containing protein [Opitutaceae bacterium]
MKWMTPILFMCGCTSILFALNDPRTISGNVLWLDGSDVDGDFQIGGSFVNGSVWVDKSTANNADASQTTANRRPSVTPLAHNGLTTVSFDGSDYMDVNSAAFGMLRNVSGCTVFIFASGSNAGSQSHRVIMVSTGTNAAGTRAGFNFNDSFGSSIGGTGNAGLAGRRLDSNPYQRINGFGLTNGSYGQWTGVFDYANATLKLYSNGDLSTNATNFQSAGNTSNTNSLNIRLGADAATNDERGFYTGNLGEVIIYNRVLSDSEREEVESYLANKWSIPTVKSAITDENLILTWPSAALYWKVEASGELGIEAFDSTSLTPTIENDQYKVSIPTTNGKAFFRLSRP